MKGNPQVVAEIMIKLSKATKAMIQLQIGSLCNIVVARRDHFLANTKGLTPDQLVALWLKSFFNDHRIFNDEIISTVNVINRNSLHDKAMKHMEINP